MSRPKRPRLSQNRNIRVMEWLVLILISFALLVGVLSAVNRKFGRCIGNYDVIVTDVTYRFGGTAYFINQSGEESCVDLHDFWITRSDDADFVEAGDIIKVGECAGLFGNTYYVWDNHPKQEGEARS